MKKIKNLWINNKFVIIICVILIICLGAICYVAATYFFGGSDSVYGDRLDDIDDYPFSDSDMEEVISLIEESEEVSSASIRLSGKIIYVSVIYNEEIALEETKVLAATSLEYFDEDLLGYYDLNYTLSSDNFTLMGYKNSASTSIVWNNNTSYDEEESE